MLRRITMTTVACLLVFCPALAAGEVQVHGALRAMFHQGQTGTMVTLDTLLPNPDLYAVGAITDLSGEITIIAGKTYLSWPDEDGTSRTKAVERPETGATLLVSTEVAAWQSVVSEKAIPLDKLGDAIMALAAGAGLDVDQRIPFLLEGVFTDLQWHVVDGSRLTGGGGSHQDHLAASVQHKLDSSQAILFGFYSKGDMGVFTHMGSRTHVHCVVEKPLSTGHVDHVVIPAGAIIRFPVTE